MKRTIALFLCIVFFAFSGCKSTETPVMEEAPLIQGDVYDYCYGCLNDTQKDMYNKILSGIYAMQTERIYLTDDGTDISENVNIAYGAVSVDHPEIFWLSGEYRLLTLGGEKFYISIKYEIDPTTRDGQAAALKNRVDKLMSETEGMAPPEKEKYFHDYLCNNVVYLNDGYAPRYTAFGALVNGKAVCEGYSKAMQLLCKTAGINCTLIKGVSDNEAHMWNTVELYGEWYEVDVTWDDTEKEEPSYRYFNNTTTQMQKTHQRYSEIKGSGSGISLKGLKYNLNPPVCTATEFSYKKENQ